MSLQAMVAESRQRAGAKARGAQGGDDPGGKSNDELRKARDGIVHYVPTEVVGFYLAALSLVAAVQSDIPSSLSLTLRGAVFGPEKTVLLICMALGTLLSFVGVVALYRNQKTPTPAFRQLPWRKASVSAIAFVLWSLAIPGLLPPWLQALDAIAALFATYIFTWFDKWIEKIE